MKKQATEVVVGEKSGCGFHPDSGNCWPRWKCQLPTQLLFKVQHQICLHGNYNESRTSPYHLTPKNKNKIKGKIKELLQQWCKPDQTEPDQVEWANAPLLSRTVSLLCLLQAWLNSLSCCLAIVENSSGASAVNCVVITWMLSTKTSTFSSHCPWLQLSRV